MSRDKTESNWKANLKRDPELVEQYRPKVEQVNALLAKARSKGEKLTIEDACKKVGISSRGVYTTYREILRRQQVVTVDPLVMEMRADLEQMKAQLRETTQINEERKRKEQEFSCEIIKMNAQIQLLIQLLAAKVTQSMSDPSAPPGKPDPLSFNISENRNR
jgi:hypothetical protein